MRRLLMAYLILLLLPQGSKCQTDTMKRGTINIGKCETMIDGKTGSVVFSVNELLKNPEIKATCSNSKVKSFELVIVYNGWVSMYSCDTNHFPSQVISLFQKLPDGSRLTIQNVTLQGEGATGKFIPGENIILRRP